MDTKDVNGIFILSDFYFKFVGSYFFALFLAKSQTGKHMNDIVIRKDTMAVRRPLLLLLWTTNENHQAALKGDLMTLCLINELNLHLNVDLR